jgi:hypothetical protein
VLSEVLSAAERNGIGLKSLDISIAADVVIEINEGYKVEIGDDTNLDYKFELMKKIIEELKGMDKTGGTIDVASGSGGYYR